MDKYIKNTIFVTEFIYIILMLFEPSVEEMNYSSCKDPDLKYLDNLLAEYSIKYWKFEQKVLKETIYLNEENWDQTDSYFARGEFFENSQCNENVRIRTKISQQSLCPWRYQILYRADKYPFYRSQVKCTCENCSGPNSLKHECAPVFKFFPILTRVSCDKNGIFNWSPDTEQINVACVCAQSLKFIPQI